MIPRFLKTRTTKYDNDLGLRWVETKVPILLIFLIHHFQPPEPGALPAERTGCTDSTGTLEPYRRKSGMASSDGHSRADDNTGQSATFDDLLIDTRFLPAV